MFSHCDTLFLFFSSSFPRDLVAVRLFSGSRCSEPYFRRRQTACHLEWLKDNVLNSLPIPALQQALLAQLKPARSAGEALHAVWSFAGPARAVAEHTLLAVLVSMVALWALFHTGRVCERRKNESRQPARPVDPTPALFQEGGVACRGRGGPRR